MKLMEQMANRSPLLVEAGSASVVFCVRAQNWRLFGKSIFHRFPLSAAVWLVSIFMVLHAGNTMGQTLSPPTQIAPGYTSSPGQLISTLTPAFSWNVVSGATAYGLYIRDITTGTLYSYYLTPGTGNYYQLPSGVLVAGHQYKWNMTTWNASGEGNALSANLLYFYTQSAAPAPSI